MQYVVDANVVVKWLLPEPDSDKADSLLDGYRQHTMRLIAPDIVVAEVGNALWQRCDRLKDISPAEAASAYTDFLDLDLPVHACNTLSEQALSISISESHPIYDTLYISLAMKRGWEFVTADEKLVNKLGPKFPLIKLLRNL
jgi:predicted nucleic acid-binding protein